MDAKKLFCGCSQCSRETKQKVSDLISGSDTLRLVIPDVNYKAKFFCGASGFAASCGYKVKEKKGVSRQGCLHCFGSEK